jgi:hypothetical protein
MIVSLEKKAASKIAQLTAATNLDGTAVKTFAEVLHLYFSNGRPAYFSRLKDDMVNVFPRILEFASIEIIFDITYNFFLFVRTTNTTLSDRENQDEINKFIFIPFQKKLAELLPHIDAKKLLFEPRSDTYVIVTRHAVTQGMYAPGKFLYSVSHALLKAKKRVVLVHFGQMDETFAGLKNYHNFASLSCTEGLIPSFLSLREIINKFRPKEVLTEIELSALNLIEAIGVSSNICLLSAGVFKTPWFDKKYLVTELYQEADTLDKSLVPIPQVHSKEILAPSCPNETLKGLRSQFALEGKFVIGSFARYEKFSVDFLRLAKRALEAIPNSVLILAGSNDQQKAANFFSEEIKKQKVILFGVVKTPIMGWVIDVFLEPFPVIAGFAVLESLAKGKPVFTLKCLDLGNYVSSRDPNLVFENEVELIAGMSAVAASSEKYEQLSFRSLEIAQSLYDDTALASSICLS